MRGQTALRLITVSLALGLSVPAFAQSSLLQGGPWTPGHAPSYVPSGSSQPVVTDSGPARGGATGTGLSELLLQATGTGLPPYVGQGTGPFGTIQCLNDGPTNAAAGYHFLCFSPNVNNGGLIAYGAGGIAPSLPLNFNINGQAINPVSCSGTPSSSFATINGIVTHC